VTLQGVSGVDRPDDYVVLEVNRHPAPVFREAFRDKNF